MSYRYRYHVIPLSKRRQPYDVGDICGQLYDSTANSTSVILHHIDIDIYICKRETKMPFCCFDIDKGGIGLLKRRRQFATDRYLLLNWKRRREYTILIKFDIGIAMLAQTMSHWYRFHAVQLSWRWNSDIDHSMSDRSFTLPSYAIFIPLRYSGRRRIDIDLMQFCDLGEILWQVLLIRIYNGISQLDATMQNIYIFLFWRLARISYFHGRIKL